VGNLILDTEGGYLLAGVVCPIIEDDSMRKAEVTHNVLTNELDHLEPSEFGERHNFDPFGEVLSCD